MRVLPFIAVALVVAEVVAVVLLLTSGAWPFALAALALAFTALAVVRMTRRRAVKEASRAQGYVERETYGW